MMTLAEYARQQFPDLDVSGDGGRELRSHSAVVQVVGRRRTQSIADALRGRYGGDVASVTLHPDHVGVVAKAGEDKEGIASLPARRMAVASLALGLPVGIAVGLIAGFASGDATVGVIAGVFCAVVAGWVAGLLGGGGRFAGQRAWEQVRVPDTTIGLVAVLVDDEARAVAALESVDHREIVDTRVVDDHGTWHSPNTFA
jgi:hypothetical protein